MSRHRPPRHQRNCVAPPLRMASLQAPHAHLSGNAQGAVLRARARAAVRVCAALPPRQRTAPAALEAQPAQRVRAPERRHTEHPPAVQPRRSGARRSRARQLPPPLAAPPVAPPPALRPGNATAAYALGGAAVLLLLLPALPADADSAASAASAAPVLSDILSDAASKAFRGGAAGFAAGALQVLAFMWLRTAMNVQYANGGTLRSSLASLWAEGGVRRLYQGVSVAIVQAPLSRFGDTAANTGVLALFGAAAPGVPLPVATAAASAAGAAWRLLLTPLDTYKTTRQVAGDASLARLRAKVAARGPVALWDGAVANAAASWVGSFPWFVTYNALQASLPPADGVLGLARAAACGCAASAVSDTASNGLRVLKTVRQTSADGTGYVDAAKAVLAADGVSGLLGRGLATRLLVNLLQGALFSVAWKAIEAQLSR